MILLAQGCVVYVVGSGYVLHFYHLSLSKALPMVLPADVE